MYKSKGFTIIELLVVVAIIAVLAAIVLVNVTSYISKGKDAAAKGNLSTLIVNAAVFFDQNSEYENFPSYVGFTSVSGALTQAGYTMTSYCSGAAGACSDGTQNFCASVTMKTNTANSYCVDTTGWKREGATANNVCLTTGACATT